MRVAFGSRVTAIPQRMASDPALYAVSALLFVASVAVTIAVYAPMSARCGMAMPGGSTTSMMWMRPPGRTWSAAAASFVSMWAAMMVAMMLPSLVPMLRRHRNAVRGADGRRLGWLTALVGAGYYLVWTMVGMPAYATGVALAEIAMRQPALARFAPMAIGVVVVIGGALQFTVWKARHLACCRRAPGPGRTLPADAVTALRHGLRLGVHCTCS